jgi:hypothetical protein
MGILEGILITSDPISTYGGVCIPPEEIRRLFESFSDDDELTLGLHHNPLQPMKARLLRKELRETESGSLAIWAAFEIDDDDLLRLEGIGGSPLG